MLNAAISKISAQQGQRGTAVWMVGEHLKDICQREPKSAELLAQDLDNAALSLAQAEKKIKAYADSHRSGSFACVTPDIAEEILRKFYGLSIPEQDGGTTPIQSDNVLNLEDFLV